MHSSDNSTFERLQHAWVERTKDRGGAILEEGTIVVLPSLTFPIEELRKIIGILHYEERFLFLTQLLRNPEIRMVYLSSLEIEPTIVDYYLSLIPGVDDARRRLTLISARDTSLQPLTAKLLANEALQKQIRDAVDHDENAYIFPFNVTHAEAELAAALGLPLYGPSPDLVTLGSKSNSRRIARAAGVEVLPGHEDLFSVGEVERAMVDLQSRLPEASAFVVKLNNGFSGQGNAIIDLETLRTPLVETPTVFCASEESWASFGHKIEEQGAIVEELLREPHPASPSVQLSIAPGGSIEVLSTHDQILGGPDDQVYLGCRFPARAAYRREILDRALAVAEVLAGRGVFGAFGIDFIVGGDGPDHRIYLSEINLRTGGTTHPFGMAARLTRGHYDFGTGELIADGQSKCYIGTDNLKSPAYAGLEPAQVIEALRAEGLAFDHDRATGATLHLMGALREHGKLGVICIANSYEAVDDLYADVIATLDDLGATKTS